MLQKIRARLRADDGVAAVEFAIVSMVFLLFLYGILTYGFIFGLDQSMNHAAEEGARSAIAMTTAADAKTRAEAVALQRLSWLGSRIQASDIVANVAACPAPEASYQCITVTITYPWSTRPIVPKLAFLPAPSQMQAVAVVQLT